VIRCDDCGGEIRNHLAPGVGRYVTGVQRNRAAGGANQIIDAQPVDPPRYLCAGCCELHLERNRARVHQSSLFP
jgi:hypothetical protein